MKNLTFATLMVLCQPAVYLVNKVDYSTWDNGNGVGIIWLERNGANYKVLVHRDNNFGDKLPQASDTIVVALENFSIQECDIEGNVKWHPATNYVRCWSNLKHTICPDSDSTFLYFILTDEELIRLKEKD